MSETGTIYPSPSEEKQIQYMRKGFKTQLPSKRPRYERNIDIYATQDKREGLKIEKLESRTAFQLRVIEHWDRHIQAEGQPYYYLPKVKPRQFSYLVEHDITEQDVLDEVECFILWFEEEALEFYENGQPDEDIEVVIEIKDTGTQSGVAMPDEFKGFVWSYYMVDVKERKIFWIHDFVILEGELPMMIKKREHLQHMFGSEYWTHVKNFPNHHPVAPDAVNKSLGILSCYFIDDTLENGNGQITPFNAQDLRECLRVIERLYDSHVLMIKVTAENRMDQPVSPRDRPGYLMYCIAIVMITVAELTYIETERFRNFHGFHGARLDAHQSVRGKSKPKRTSLAKLMVPFLFYQPENNLRRFEGMYTDRLICLHDWMELQERLERDSGTFIIFATVLLAVDISLLAVPSVIGNLTQDPLPPSQTSLTTLMAQLSMITCLGSIIIGLMQGRQERVDAKDKANTYISDSKALKYLNGDTNGGSENASESQFRLESLAIQHSLPFGLLGWGIALFSVSVLASCFNANFTIIGINARRSIYGGVCGIVAFLVAWTNHIGAKINSEQLWYERFVRWLYNKPQQLWNQLRAPNAQQKGWCC